MNLKLHNLTYTTPREATDKRKAVECPGHRSSPEGASGDDGNRFGRGIIDNRQTLDHASIGRSVEHEVGGPHVVGCLRAHQGLSTGDRDLLFRRRRRTCSGASVYSRSTRLWFTR